MFSCGFVTLANRFNAQYLLYHRNNRDPNHGDYSIEVLKKQGGKNVFTQGRGAAVSAMPQELLCQINNQTLILWGQDDSLFSIEYGEAAAQIMPNASFHGIKEAGHLLMMDKPAMFNQTLCDFLLGDKVSL